MRYIRIVLMGRDFWRKQFWSILRHCPSSYLEEIEEIRKMSRNFRLVST
jgi:hypothetical protein